MSNESDRELLELAAKAAGMEVKAAIVLADGTLKGIDVGDGGATIHYWNPLTDDGEALRLAVKIAIDFSRRNSLVVARALGERFDEYAEDFDGLNAATHRAIVRAAAEIGRVK